MTGERAAVRVVAAARPIADLDGDGLAPEGDGRLPHCWTGKDNTERGAKARYQHYCRPFRMRQNRWYPYSGTAGRLTACLWLRPFAGAAHVSTETREMTGLPRLLAHASVAIAALLVTQPSQAQPDPAAGYP